jgi:DNA repair protein SbcC/Rad50
MRLHRLEVTAFGPFADRQEVDFDRLSEAGLFLLHGPTGAGKTSVLDAICFALYGRVPGARGGIGRLRSDHAAADVAPEVICDFSVSGRRFEVTRSPEWQRPKKRGTGTVREQAHVVVRERVGPDWTALTNRVDEAADLLQQLIGLGAEQFTKLILLPQGDFAAFLRATPEERRPLLQKLFGTDRFAEVEGWLADRRRELEHHIHAANTTTARLFARAEEARLAEVGRPGQFRQSGQSGRLGDDEPGRVPATLEVVAATVSGWADEARAELADAHTGVRTAEQAFDAARLAAEEAAEAVQRQRQLAAWTAELLELRSAEPEQERRRSAIRAASHALVLAPLLTEVDDAQRQQQAAQRRLEAARAGATAAGESPALAGPQRLTQLREEIGALAELLGAELDLRRLDAEFLAGEQQIEGAQREHAEAGEALARLTARRAGLGDERSAAELIAVTLPDRERDSTRAKAVAKAVIEQQQLEVRQVELKDELRAAIDVHQAGVAASQELRARRLNGMAAELAAGLTEAAPCPVCGSCEHPVPAAHTGPAVTERAQQRAEAAEKSAAAARELAQAEVNTAAEHWAGLQALTEGAGPEAAAAGLIEADRRVAEAKAASTSTRRLVTELDRIERELELVGARRIAAASLAAAAREALAETGGRRSDLRARLDRARGQDGDVRSRHRRLAAAAEAVAQCQSALAAFEDSVDRVQRALAAADRAAAAAGFADREAGRKAVLPEPERQRLVALVADHDARVARLHALLDEAKSGQDDAGQDDAGQDDAESRQEHAPGEHQLDLFSLLEVPAELGPEPADESRQVEPPDLEQLREAQAQARQAHELARERHTLAARAVRALANLAADLDQHATASAPLRRRFAVLDSVSRCAEGTGGDNALRMRLSSYVLAARLEQVADAASIRLAAMSGGRYLLVHTDGPSRGGARSGLGLAVIDGWTGVQRDPASLSGGETFCTSLALALGLADVVQAEAGGSVIETLLVDEGFGSLDEETLDEVMDVLDGLRSAGRSVGLVSHVADLRDRIPAQLTVLKTRTGSRLIA